LNIENDGQTVDEGTNNVQRLKTSTPLLLNTPKIYSFTDFFIALIILSYADICKAPLAAKYSEALTG